MNPTEYLEHLQSCAERDGLAGSDLRPCSSADIMSVEREVGMSLPEEYVDFLCQVGAGEEHGGLARWFHLDMTRPGNVIDHSHTVMSEQLGRLRDNGQPTSRYPKNMLVAYDACDGVLYGFVPNSHSTYKPGVFCWDCDELALEKVADSFYEFLDYLADDSSC